MSSLILYFKNIAIAFARIIKATIGVYHYSQDDKYFKNWWVTIDCFINALTFGDPDETISSRSAKAQLAGREWGCLMCKFLSWFQTNHCTLALERNKGSRAIVKDDTP
jgi:hypothetical protein